MTSRAFAVATLVAASVLLGSCDDTNAPPSAPSPLALEAEVSDPIDVTPVVLGQFANLTASAATQIVYISLPSGTMPDGVSAAISRLGHPVSVSAPVVEGGFDPVQLAVALDDSVSVVVNAAGGSVVLEYETSVKPRRPPKIVRTSPPRKKSDVAVNAVIVIVFTEPIDPASVGSTVRLMRGSSNVAGSAEVIGDAGTSVAFRPSATLEPNTQYRVVVGGAVADLDGETLGQDMEVEFSTGTTSVGPAASIRVPTDTVKIHTGMPGTPVTYQLTATAQDAAGNTLVDATVSWSWNNALPPSRAVDVEGLTVSNTGLITALLSGEYDVTASVTGISARVRVLIIAGPPVAATLTPDAAVLTPGDTILLTATFRDAMGFVATGPLTLRSDDPTVVRVEAALAQTGVRVIGVTAGATTITAQLGSPSVSATASITVQSAARVSIEPGSLETVAGAAVRISAVALDADGEVLPGIGRKARWSSLDPDVVSVDSVGTVTVVRLGSGRIVAQLGVALDTALVSANQLAFQSVHGPSLSDNMCGLTTAGRAYCWGSNELGQLGAGFKSPRINWPVAVHGTIEFSTLTVSQFHACGLSVQGVWFCWGVNEDGQLGDGTVTNRLTPTRVTVAPGFTSIVAGGQSSCGLTSAGDAYCWGRTGGQARPPRLIPGGHKFASLSPNAGLPFLEQGPIDDVCGLTLSGSVYCWALYAFPPTEEIDVVPSAAGFTFSALGFSPSHLCGVTANGQIHCWGMGTLGQLGHGSAPTEHADAPVQVSGDQVFSASIALSWSGTSCALTTDGDAYCWGRGDFGSLGTGAEGPDRCSDEFGDTSSCSKVPVRVSGGLKFKSLAASNVFCAVTIDNVAYCWGGRLLGNGNTAPSFVPVKVGGQP